MVFWRKKKKALVHYWSVFRKRVPGKALCVGLDWVVHEVTEEINEVTCPYCLYVIKKRVGFESENLGPFEIMEIKNELSRNRRN